MSNQEHNLKLILSLRWISIAALGIILFPALKLGWLQSHTRLPAALLISALAAANAASVFAQNKKFVRPTPGYLLAQLSFDLFVLTGLLWLTGGAWNPFIVVMFFHAALSALILQGLHLLGFLMLLFWSSTALYSNPVVPTPAQGQSLPSVLLYPIHMTVLLSLVALIAWVSHRLETKRRTIEEAKDEIRKIDHLRAFGVLATGFSHEFATPLSTLQMRLKRLHRQNLDLAENDDLRAALEAAQQCENKLKGLLNCRRNLDECSFEKIDVVQYIRELSNTWESSETLLKVSLPQAPLEIRSPVTSFKQVIADLLDNARRASPRGTIRLTAEKDRASGHLRLKIEDEGPGLPDIVRTHLGEPFVTTRDDGNGLGLFHAVSFAKALGGMLSIDDRPEGGTKITLQLPLFEHRFA